MDLLDLITEGQQHQASDLHLHAGVVPMLRIDGDLRIIKNTVILSEHDVFTLLRPYLNHEAHVRFQAGHDVDTIVIVTERQQRLRANLFHQQHGSSAVLRFIPQTVPSLASLNAPAVFTDIAQQKNGLVLVTGPTGSGKSTTLAAIIHHINSTRAAHIITLEDPIEYIHTTNTAIINQRQVNTHIESFNVALRSMLRADPNIILIGELRDLDTMKIALTAAETGHLVFATLHTSSALTAIHRMIDVFPGSEKDKIRTQLSESLNAIIAQTLVKQNKGGRIAVYEILRATAAVRHMIRDDKIAHIYSVMQTNHTLGMCTQEQAFQQLMQEGKITG